MTGKSLAIYTADGELDYQKIVGNNGFVML